MALTPSEKRKAKRKLFELSDDKERSEIMLREMEEVHDRFDSLSSALSEGATKREISALVDALSKDMAKMRSAYIQQMGSFSDAFKEQNDAFLKGIKEMHETLKKQSFASEINAHAGPLYKTMINSLSGMEKSFSTWKYPQYAAVSVRDTSFSNINPSIAPFNITSPFDYVSLTYSGSNVTVAVYKSGGVSGRTVATLTLAYSGSNLVSVTRT